jgi:hypothetical protein
MKGQHKYTRVNVSIKIIFIIILKFDYEVDSMIDSSHELKESTRLI